MFHAAITKHEESEALHQGRYTYIFTLPKTILSVHNILYPLANLHTMWYMFVQTFHNLTCMLCTHAQFEAVLAGESVKDTTVLTLKIHAEYACMYCVHIWTHMQLARARYFYVHVLIYWGLHSIIAAQGTQRARLSHVYVLWYILKVKAGIIYAHTHCMT
jgi:hypothetical protein